MKALYPLFEFVIDVNPPVPVDDGICITQNDIVVTELESYNMSEEDKNLLAMPYFCLKVDKNKQEPEIASISFVVASRLVKRTKVFIRYRVDNSTRLIKIRDDYPFASSPETTTLITSVELQRLCDLYRALNQFKQINNRALNAVYFLGLACRSRKWLESLLFYVNALETLTSATQQERNITDKFIDRIHNFIGHDEDELKEIYNKRSELVHGRSRWLSEEENLRLYLIAEKVCRKVFSKILLEENYVELFNDDLKRLNMF